MLKKWRQLLSGAMLLIYFGMPVHAAGKLRVQLSGTHLKGNTYTSPVSLEISGAAEEERILIKENGRWMSLSPGPDGEYRLDFTADGDYSLRFCAETADGQRSGFTDARFTIDRETAAFIESCRRLPDPEMAAEEQLLLLEEELLALQRRKNALDEGKLALIPSRMSRTLSTLLLRLGELRPQLDITPPEPPQLRFLGEPDAAGRQVYRGAVRLEIAVPQKDFNRLLMRTGEEWEPLEAAEGVYTLECSTSGEYRYDFCCEDAAGNRSTLSRAEFIISPGLFAFYDSIDLKTGLGVEQALMRYQLFDSRGRSLVDEKLVRQLEFDYKTACGQSGHTAQDWPGGKTLRVLGMLSGFYGRQGIQLKAQGQPVTEDKTISGKKLLWEYTLSFTDAQGNAAEPKNELLVSVQLPPELLKKKNVMAIDAEGKLLESHLRNEDDGFVLTFPVWEGGTYSVGADA